MENVSYRNFSKGDLVCHFKWHKNTKEEMESNKYVYKVIVVGAQHTETGEIEMVYEAQYDDFKSFVRPLDMFLSEVDREKYPDVEQKYRLIKYNENALKFYSSLTKEDKKKILGLDYSLAQFLNDYKVDAEFYDYIRENFIFVQ